MAADDRQQMSQRATEQAQKLKSLLTPVRNTSSYISIGSKRKADTDASVSPNGEPPAKSFKDDQDAAQCQSDTAEEQPKPSIVVTTPSGKPTPLAKGAVGALVGGDESDEEPEDGIRLWEAGWKDRYYNAKFEVSESNRDFRKKVACAYVEGLAWVLRYYYQGCASWTWYYPFHYAPFASDFDLIGNFEPDFSKPTKPFKPLEQLMGVFPAASRSHIPAGWRSLMTEPNSPIFDFYPEEFEIDLNGKKFAWQGVALLPFVDEKRLLDALTKVYDTLTPEEQARNMTGPDRLFVGKEHTLFELIHEVHKRGKGFKNEAPIWVTINPSKDYGISGEVCHDATATECNGAYVSMFRNSLDFGDIKSNNCIMVKFRDPQFPLNYRYKASRLDGINELPRVLKPNDYNERRYGPYRPQIGFSRDIPQASFSSPGHRMLNHQIREQQYQRRSGPPGYFFYQQPPPF